MAKEVLDRNGAPIYGGLTVKFTMPTSEAMNGRSISFSGSVEYQGVAEYIRPNRLDVRLGNGTLAIVHPDMVAIVGWKPAIKQGGKGQ